MKAAFSKRRHSYLVKIVNKNDIDYDIYDGLHGHKEIYVVFFGQLDNFVRVTENFIYSVNNK